MVVNGTHVIRKRYTSHHIAYSRPNHSDRVRNCAFNSQRRPSTKKLSA